MSAKGGKIGSAGHTAGIFADMTLDGPEIGTLVAVIDRAKNLPNRRTMGKQDPYCAMRLGKEAKRTSTDKRGGQTPRWDQELRFTVHESPDYLKLKCSVFNDDKKTDLIGEAWIDLTAVIVPGGGQNDLWHQLQFRGKYAGDVRMELTYYDTRPKDGLLHEKKRNKEKADSSRVHPSSHDEACPRQIGPREVKRRPLPIEPLKHASATKATPSEQASSSPSFQHHQYDSRYSSRHSYGDPRASNSQFNARGSTQNPYHFTTPPGNQFEDEFLEYQNEYDERQQAAYSNVQFQSQPSYHSLGHPDEIPHSDSLHFHSARSSLHGSPAQQQQHLAPTAQRCQGTQASDPGEYGGSYNSVPTVYGSSPPSSGLDRPSPPSADTRNPQFLHRGSTSPIRNDVYRDSPLRQSISQDRTEADCEADYDTSEDELPPLPPAHRDNMVTATSRPDLHADMLPVQMPQPLKIGANKPRLSPFDRSPLQNIERNYAPQHQSQFQDFSPSTGKDYTRSPHSEPICSSSNQPAGWKSYSRPTFGVENMPPSLRPSHGRASNDGDDFWLQNGRQAHRQSFSQSALHLNQDPDALDNGYLAYHRPQVEDEGPRFVSEPQVTKVQTASPDLRTVPKSKTASPQPLPSQGEKELDNIPFGPDSYSVFNPSSPLSSAVTGPEGRYETPEQAREAARQHEVQKLRDQGPIIGNDGRVIDPSDHLPTDTWAPEPERKNRKPDLVIRYKTKDNPPRAPHRPESSPGAVRPHSIAGPIHGSSPLASESSGRFAHQTDGGNRLQKHAPGRPSHMQPYQQIHSSPAVPTASHITPPRMQTYPTRPDLSDYSLYGPPKNSNVGGGGNSGAPFGGAPPIPAKIPHSYHTGRDDRYGGYGGGMDALSAELSTIDIGTSPGGRGGWPRRGYGF